QLLPNDANAGKSLHRPRQPIGEVEPVDREAGARRHPGRVRHLHDDRPEAPHLFFEETHGRFECRFAEGVRAHELAQTIGLVRLGAPHAPHLGDEAGVALGARRGDRLVPGDELACRIARAAVEGLPAAGPALEHLALAAAEAGDPGRDGLVKRLHVPALGIPRAPEELTEAPEPHLHGATALLAYPIRPFRLNWPDAPLVVAR